MWAIDKQAKNTNEAIQIATNIYNKASNIVSSFAQDKKSFKIAQKNIDTASKKVGSWKGNFISLVENFKDTRGIISTKRIKNENDKSNTLKKVEKKIEKKVAPKKKVVKKTAAKKVTKKKTPKAKK